MIFEKWQWPSFIWLLMFALLMYSMGKHFRHISASVDPLDDEVAMIQDVKLLVPSAAHVSFATDLSDDEASQGAYYRTQFCWCPMILTDKVKESEYIIFYHSPAAKDCTMSFLHHCDTAWQRTGNSYTMMLLKPNNR